MRLAREAGVNAIISGHLHRYERRVVDGVRCFTVGTGGGRIGADEFTQPPPARRCRSPASATCASTPGAATCGTRSSTSPGASPTGRGRRDPAGILAAGRRRGAGRGSLAVDRPERFAITAPCGLLVTIVVGAGAIAADAVPLRRIPLACTVVTFVLGVVLVVGAR